MSGNDRWLLPQGIEEILPEEACQLEKMRRDLLDLFSSWGYELVMPPMFEFLDSLLTGLGQDLDLQTFKITDQLTGRLMGVRADMTPQVARIEAHYLKRKGPVRLCYLGPVLRTRSDDFDRSREPLQLGAELFGHVSPESDAEILHLMIEAMLIIGITKPSIDLGHVGVFRGLVQENRLRPEPETQLFDALKRKARPDIETLLHDADISDSAKRIFATLIDLNGDISVLEQAEAAFDGAGDAVYKALENLTQVTRLVSKLMPDVPLYFDLAELRGYRYHTGVVFYAFTPGYGQEIAQGGRYDDIGKAFGYARPATGFSTDLRTLLKLSTSKRSTVRCILAPVTGDAAVEIEIARLRKSGEGVIKQFPGVNDTDMKNRCDRKLVKKGGRWVVVDL